MQQHLAKNESLFMFVACAQIMDWNVVKKIESP
jgi:hypothetical protein